jgi:serine/threonine protein kinase
VHDDDVNAPTLRASAAGREGTEIPPGAVVCGRYEIRGVIGEGGMGRVLAAWDRLVEREVALKQVRPSGLRASDAEMARLRDELVAIQDVVHPGIVRTYTLEEEGGERFLVMERLRGRSLADARRDGAFAIPEALRIARALLDALAAVHARGLAHRDVKPGNVFLCDDGRVVLLDFGLARAGLAPSGDVGEGAASARAAPPTSTRSASCSTSWSPARTRSAAAASSSSARTSINRRPRSIAARAGCAPR